MFNNSVTPLRNVDLPRPQLSPAAPSSIDAEKVHLIQEDQHGIGTWVGLFDDDLKFQKTLVKWALESLMLMNAICALTARQMSIVSRGAIWKSATVRYYGESLHQLIKTLQGRSYFPDDTLATTVLLSSYELLFAPGLDHLRHVYSSLTLIRTHTCKAGSKGVVGAAFWVYVCRAVYGAGTSHNASAGGMGCVLGQSGDGGGQVGK
jgi:hypothetical protein